MSTWITVYCAHSLGDLHALELAAGLRGDDPQALAGVDYQTLAEDYEIDESLVENCAKSLSVKKLPEVRHEWFRVHFSVLGSEPLTIYRWAQPERVAEEISEVLDRLNIDNNPLAKRFRNSCEVIGIELTSSQFAEMGVVVAYEAARYLAQRGNGIIVNDSDEVVCVKEGVFRPC